MDLGPFATSLGLTLTSASGEEVVGDWRVTEVMLQPAGLLHGGVHCAVVETLASVGASLWLGDRGQVVGVVNSTDFFRASRPGDRLTSTAAPIHRGVPSRSGGSRPSTSTGNSWPWVRCACRTSPSDSWQDGGRDETPGPATATLHPR